MNHAVVRSDLLRVHAEDAAMLVRLRALMTEAPNVRLLDIYEIDQRLDGHFRYLRMCGKPAIMMAADVFSDDPETGEATVLACLAMQGGSQSFVGRIMDAVSDQAAAITAIARGFQYCDTATRRTYLGAWLTSDDPVLSAIAVETAIHHRVNVNDRLGPLTRAPATAVRARAIELAGVMGNTGYGAAAQDAMTDADPDVQYAGTVAACRFGQVSAAEALINMIGPDLAAARCREAVEIGFPLLPQETAHALVRALIGNPDTRRWGILGLGAIGATRALPFVIDEIDDPLMSRMAGWAFSMITGANIAEDDLELEVFPEDPDNPLLEDADEEDFIETALPWPDKDLVIKWMADHGATLAQDHPLLFGLPQWTYQDMDSHDLEFQGRYRTLAQQLAVRAPDNKLPHWRAPVRLKDQKLIRDWKI